MTCPFCGSESTKVLDTRTCRGDRIRKRLCGDCGRRFSTAERITAEYLQVRKRDGTVEPFSRAKLRRSIMRAACGSRLGPAEVDLVVNRVVEILQPEAPDLPILSRDIGDLVLQQLNDTTEAAEITRVRYAIAFLSAAEPERSIRGIKDLLAWLESFYPPPETGLPAATPTLIAKRDGRVEAYLAGKLAAGIAAAAKGRRSAAELERWSHDLASRVTAQLRGQTKVTSQQVASEVLRLLKDQDQLAYLRFAVSVKLYLSVDDLWLDAMSLLDPLQAVRGSAAGNDA